MVLAPLATSPYLLLLREELAVGSTGRMEWRSPSTALPPRESGQICSRFQDLPESQVLVVVAPE